jgi:dolichyl-phosphate-mannose--protein O-mannosyl transferase
MTLQPILKQLNTIKSFCSREILERPWFFLAILIVGSFLLRIWHLGAIREEIFDEVYFVHFAKNYLSGTSFFDIHPPLGKLIIALGIKIFSDTQFGWRIMSAIFGAAVILLGYLTGKELKKPADGEGGKIVGLLAAAILALDGLILVYSRVGLMDIFMIFFTLLGFWSFLKFANSKKLIYLVLAGLSLGLAASVKYIAGLLFLTFLLIIFIKKIPLKKIIWQFLIFILVLPTLIYLAFFLFNFPANSHFFAKVLEWHQQSLNYNLTLKEGHPYGSKWWTWFLLLRPIWFYFKDIDGHYLGIVGLGNPLAWWSSLLVVPILIWRIYKKDTSAAIILGSFLIFLLPWAFFRRVLFYYHALSAFVFVSLGTAYLLEKLFKDNFGKLIVFIYFLILIFLFFYFLPIWMAWPISSDQFYHRMWLKSWI